MARAAGGDEPAFTELVDLWYPRCLRYAVHLLGNQADAEEAVQDTFIRVHRALPSYEHRQRFGAWLYRILLNCCRTRIAAARRAREFMPGQAAPEVAASPGPWEGEWERQIELGLAALPALQREAFLLHYVEGLGYEEMAAVTGEGISTLKMRVKRAKDRFITLLRESDHV
jgi:RNA polymerase sigma-70 factor (ECF subfamily)